MKKFIKGLFFGAAAGTIGGLLAAPRSGKETRQHLINELEDYRSLKNQVTNDWDQVQRNLAVVEENVPLATEFSKDLQQEITDFKFQADPRIAQIKEQARLLGIKSIVRRDQQLTIHWHDDSKMADWDMGCTGRSLEEDEICRY